ncbi:hypothetical protein G3N55_12255 [Dissulfurirhabdus thermomarina]|uniref:Uncharacterized protein n=1 Tax=Dissulfurirhabdus thermomarina TaxID=1765737 RepID=A0A6N9TYT1_DISTH|nr:hypothetical protein [Dissulfurirhabdus thermomarina]NDY43606.1 hypothetical protein [Dissulfurirhabdus thermomarina]NMX23149.1 hypothetical protein [Dissulfurirhabdus thermomarina]
MNLTLAPASGPDPRRIDPRWPVFLGICLFLGPFAVIPVVIGLVVLAGRARRVPPATPAETAAGSDPAAASPTIRDLYDRASAFCRRHRGGCLAGGLLAAWCLAAAVLLGPFAAVAVVLSFPALVRLAEEHGLDDPDVHRSFLPADPFA